jgi:uncharacterized protein RhaS with RHS repeats
MGHRYYDPKTGRWTQTDPIDQSSDLREGNRYGYVGGNPVNAVDPSGMLLDDLFGDGVVGTVWDCINPVSEESLTGLATGAGIGFTAGASSAQDLGGVGAVGVGLVSGAAGAKIGHTVGSTAGCVKSGADSIF